MGRKIIETDIDGEIELEQSYDLPIYEMIAMLAEKAAVGATHIHFRCYGDTEEGYVSFLKKALESEDEYNKRLEVEKEEEERFVQEQKDIRRAKYEELKKEFEG